MKEKNYTHKHALMLTIITVAIAIFPGQLKATTFDNDASITFAWNHSVGNITHYEVYVSENNNPFHLEGTTTSASYEISGLSSNEYRIMVRAVNAVGPGAYSDASDPVICDTVSPTKPTIDDDFYRCDIYTVEIELLQPSTDDYLKTYQVKGGQYSVWTDTTETDCFTFTIDPYQEQLLRVRAVDLAGNNGPRDIVTVTVDSDSDGQPDVDEIVCGTDANDPDSCFVMQLDQDRTTGASRLSWNASRDRAYQVFYSDDLKQWHLADIVVADTSSELIWIDDGVLTGTLPAETDQRFYRVCVANNFDSDRDGSSDFDEVLFGTDMADPFSTIDFTVVKEQFDGNPVLEWTAAADRLYQIYYLDIYNNWTFAETVTAELGAQIQWKDDGTSTYPAPSDVRWRLYKICPIYNPITT